MGRGLSAGLTKMSGQKLVFLWWFFEITGGLSGLGPRTVRRYNSLVIPRVAERVDLKMDNGGLSAPGARTVRRLKFDCSDSH